MRIEQIVMNDLLLNLIGSLMALILAASFIGIIELPFELPKVEEQKAESGVSRIRATKILVFKEGGKLMAGLAGDKFPIEEVEDRLGKLNPALPVYIIAETNSGFEYDQLVRLLTKLRDKGIRNAALMAQGD